MVAEGALCWIEIPAVDPHKIKDFYAAAFPEWEFRPESTKSAMGSEVIHYSLNSPSGVSGGIVQMPSNLPKAADQPLGRGFTNYYFVDSIEEASERIHSLGGKTVLPKQKEGDNGWFCNFIDIEGNRFGIYEVSEKMKSSS